MEKTPQSMTQRCQYDIFKINSPKNWIIENLEPLYKKYVAAYDLWVKMSFNRERNFFLHMQISPQNLNHLLRINVNIWKGNPDGLQLGKKTMV